MALTKCLATIIVLSFLGAASASPMRRHLMQAAAPEPSIPTSGTELLCYQNIGSNVCCGYSPGLPSSECEQYSGAVYNQTFVAYDSACIWPLAVNCSLIKPLTNTTVGLYTLNFADPPTSAAVLGQIPLCNSTYTASMTAAYNAGKLNTTAQGNIVSIAKNLASILSDTDNS